MRDWDSILDIHNRDDLRIIYQGYSLNREELNDFCEHVEFLKNTAKVNSERLGVYLNFFKLMKELLNISELDDLADKVNLLDDKLLGLTRTVNQHKSSRKH